MADEQKVHPINDQQKIADFLKDQNLSLIRGRGGDKTMMCSVSAINYALTGEIVDTKPEHMSPLVHRWIMQIQDAMPNNIRNSAEWRELLPASAFTDAKHDEKRVEILHSWTINTVIAQIDVTPEQYNFDADWATITPTDAAIKAANTAYFVSGSFGCRAQALLNVGYVDDAQITLWKTFNVPKVLEQLIELS